MEYRLRRADGVYRWFLVTGIPRRLRGGEFVGYIGSCVDVTERVEAQAQLERSNERFRLAASAVSAVIYEWDLATGEVFRTQGLVDVVGFRPRRCRRRPSGGMSAFTRRTWTAPASSCSRRSTTPGASRSSTACATGTRPTSTSGTRVSSSATQRAIPSASSAARRTSTSGAAPRRSATGSSCASSTRGARPRRPAAQGRVPRDRLARAAHAAQRDPRLGADARAPAGARRGRPARAGSRPSSATRASQAAAHRGPARRLAHHLRQAPARRRSRSSSSSVVEAAARHGAPGGRRQGHPRSHDGARPAGRPGARRPGAAAAGRLEPALQRHQVHAARAGASRCALERVNSHVEIVVERHRRGHPRRVPAARLRPLPPGRRVDHAQRTAGSGSASRSCATSSSCTAASCAPRATGEGQGATFTVRLPVTRRSGASRRTRRGAAPGRGDAEGSTARRASRACACSSSTTSRTRASSSRRSSTQCGAEVEHGRVGGRGARGARSRRAPDVLVSRHRHARRGRLRADPPRPRAPAERGGRVPAIALTAYARAEDRVRALSPASRRTSPSRSSRPSCSPWSRASPGLARRARGDPLPAPRAFRHYCRHSPSSLPVVRGTLAGVVGSGERATDHDYGLRPGYGDFCCTGY